MLARDGEFTPAGTSAILQIFNKLDEDRSGGLGFVELSKFFTVSEPDFHFTREMFNDLEVDTLGSGGGKEVSPTGFQTFYNSVLESDATKGEARLRADIKLFGIKEEVVVIDDDSFPPIPFKPKKDAFAEMLQNAAVKRQSVPPKRTTRNKQQRTVEVVAKPKPPVSKPLIEEVDLTSSNPPMSKLHPFFQPKSVSTAPVAAMASSLLSTTTNLVPPMDVKWQLLDYPWLPVTTTPLLSPPLPLRALLPPLPIVDSNHSVLDRDIWCSSPSYSLVATSATSVTAESELWTEKYKCDSFANLLLPQKSKVQGFLQTWLNTRQQPSSPVPHSGGLGDDDDDEDESSAWGDSRDDAPPAKERHVLLLYGPHGCGKTLAVHVIAKQLGFGVLEVNASDDLLQLEKLHGEATQSYGLQNKKSKLAIPLVLLDEFDAEFDSAKLQEEQTLALKKFALKSKCPIILIPKSPALPTAWSTNNESIDRVRNLYIECVRCDCPAVDQVVGVLQHVVQCERVAVSEEACHRLAMTYKCDLRKCLNHLQFGLPLPGVDDLDGDGMEEDGIPDLVRLCPRPEIESVCNTTMSGQCLSGKVFADGVHCEQQQLDDGDVQLVADDGNDGSSGDSNRDEEDELWEDAPAKRLVKPLHQLHVVNQYWVGQRLVQRTSDPWMVSRKYKRSEDDSLCPIVIAVSCPVDAPAAHRNLAVLRNLSIACDWKVDSNDHSEEEEEDEDPTQPLRHWFQAFIHDRASFTCQVPQPASLACFQSNE
ncbi:hypothetical protein BASA81_004489 [Batrachochytrium salamandrivorans]|nr:hypothetical protein BASA81_004489 [Batrachochytrium salamandrivorans]